MYIIIVKFHIPVDEKAENSINFIKAGDRYYILSGEKGNINAFKTRQKAMDCFSYGKYHQRGGTWSTSALMHLVQYQPVIYKLDSEDIAELTEKFFPNQIKFNTGKLSSSSGRLTGIEIESPELGKLRYDEGESINLI